MNCERIDALLIDYLYGELEPEESWLFTCHLEECRACSDKAASFAGIRTLAADMADPEPSKMAVNRVLALAREDAEEKSVLTSGFGWLKILASLCVMVMVGGLVVYQMRFELAPRSELMTLPENAGTVQAPPARMSESAESDTETQLAANTPEPASPPVFRDYAAPAAKPVARTSFDNDQGLSEPMVVFRASPMNSDRFAPMMNPDRIIEMLERPAGEPGSLSRRGLMFVPRGFTAGSPGSAPRISGVAKMAESARDIAVAEKPASQLARARNAFDMGDFELAAETLRNLVKSLPPGHADRHKALLWLARAYEGKGDKAVAIDVYRTLADESPADREAALRRIRALSGD